MDRILSSQWSQFIVIISLAALVSLAILVNALFESEAATEAVPTSPDIGSRPPEPMLVLFDELQEPALKLPNYTVSGAVEITGDPEDGDGSFQVLIEQSDWDDYHVLVVNDPTQGAASEFWVVDGTIYVPSAEGGMLPVPGSVDPELNAPGWFYLRILSPEDLERLEHIGREIIDGVTVDHYEDDLSEGVPFDPPDGECYDHLDGNIDLWVDIATGLMIRLAGHMRWVNCDGDEQSLRYTFTVDQQGTTQDVASQIPTSTPTPTPTQTPTPAPGEPIIIFEVSPPQVQPGGEVIVRWDVRDADRVVIEPLELIGELEPTNEDARHFEGERTVVITEPTTFRLLATNEQTNLSSERTMSVTTIQPTPTPTPTPTATPMPAPGEPDIELFDVSTDQVEPGEEVTVRWDVRDADRVVIEPLELIGELEPTNEDARHFEGERTVVITEPTTFRLIAINDESGLVSEREKHVTIEPPTPTPTNTPTLTPTPTNTPTLTPTPTNTPTPTPTPTNTPTPTPTPTNTPTPTPTPLACEHPVVRGFGELWEGNVDIQTSMGCPLYPEQGIDGAWQPFQNGEMIWLDLGAIDTLCLTDGWILVVYDGGVASTHYDTFVEGDPASDPSIDPPPGYYQPELGFGKVWREEPGVREALGWAEERESSTKAVFQRFEHGFMVWLEKFNNERIWVFDITQCTASSGSWELFPDTYID